MFAPIAKALATEALDRVETEVLHLFMKTGTATAVVDLLPPDLAASMFTSKSDSKYRARAVRERLRRAQIKLHANDWIHAGALAYWWGIYREPAEFDYRILRLDHEEYGVLEGFANGWDDARTQRAANVTEGYLKDSIPRICLKLGVTAGRAPAVLRALVVGAPITLEFPQPRDLSPDDELPTSHEALLEAC